MNIPEGFKLVPVEPTMPMLNELMRWRECGNVTAWRHILHVAPTPPQPIYDEAKERELFEAWSANHCYLGGCAVTMEDGEYKDTDMQYSWESWEARAKSMEVGDE